jgi:hypothetical protein
MPVPISIKRYPFIYLWGKDSGSHPSYIQSVMEKARDTNAPATAIYMKQDGSWAVIDDCSELGRPDFILGYYKRALEYLI